MSRESSGSSGGLEVSENDPGDPLVDTAPLSGMEVWSFMLDTPRIILHIDMDSFFASVEVREHPEFAGKPVIVGADPKLGKGRGVVSTSSYEARKFGVYSAMPISRAYQLCPEAVFVTPHFPLYEKASRAVMQILRRYTDRVEQVSIDEAYLDLSELRSFEAARNVAEEIKSEIKMQEGLTCSIGIASGRVIAKIATDFAKPDGLTIVTPGLAAGFLSPLPVERIPGIGKKTAQILHDMGVFTIGDLSRADIQQLIGRFGRSVIGLQKLARGGDESGLSEFHGTRSISREITFDEDTADPQALFAALERFSRELFQTITEERLAFRTVTVKIRYQDFFTRTKARSTDLHHTDLRTITDLSRELFTELYNGEKVRLLGLRLSSLKGEDSNQKRIDEFLTASRHSS
jgi:DNA polymerase IV (DinB-like DNA polymerase)